MTQENIPLAGSLFDEMRQMVYGLFRAQAIYVAATLGIADCLVGGPRHVDDIARRRTVIHVR